MSSKALPASALATHAAWRTSDRRWMRQPLLALPLVLLAHALIAWWWPDDQFGWGDAQRGGITRMDVSFVRELRPSAPPTAPAPQAAVRQAPAAARPASAPAERAPPPAPEPRPMPASDSVRPTEPAEPAASAEPQAALPPPALPPAPPADLVAAARDAAAPAASAQSAGVVADAAASVASAAASAASTTAPAIAAASNFEWPPSTRLSYTVTGNYRGPVEGQGHVEWIKSGARYQVHMEVSIGPSFAPLLTRRASSEGLVTEGGLEPRRYEEVTRAAFGTPRRLSVTMDPDRVVLANGRELPRPPKLQDTASQFVQMTWLFTTQPQMLVRGTRVQFALALPRHAEPWTYEVGAAEPVATAVGEVLAYPVVPLRDARPGGDLSVEFWVAPSLQYLPVRVIIRQSEDSFLELRLEKLPQQAVRAAAPAGVPRANAPR